MKRTPSVSSVGSALLPLAAWLLIAAGPLSLPVVAQTLQPQTRPSGTAEAEIHDLILRANRAQEQSISAGDSAVMRDSSTDRYYREMVQVNRSLMQAGVVTVTMIDIEWGAITVIGDTATAITDETWIATFSDGTVRESRDRNLYYLVLQNGHWLIDEDEHPDDRTPLTPGERQV